MLGFRSSVALPGLFLALLFAGCEAELGQGGAIDRPAAAGREADRVDRVVDGDTIALREAGKVRFIGVDTPEVYGGVECFGRRASAYMKRLLPEGTRVEYRPGVEQRDRYGRLLAYVYGPNGRMVNAELVREGYATQLTIPPNVEFAELFRRLAREAREKGRGLWSACA
ncbi:MAG: thermonuclease family protein [Thermoleophilaceae bacterium]|nr:thermonuclease family protein [Thermoleophilaceae bacterium]